VPFLIGKEGSDVVGLATAWAEQLKMIFVYPHVRDPFFPVLLGGITTVMAGRGSRRLEALVRQADYVFFEEAGWHCLERDAEPGWSRMERKLAVAESA
jgi:hypothetical protein